MIHTKPDFYNSVQSDIKERYFKEEPNYSHNEKYNAAKYTIELFNNGCLNYRAFIGRLAKYCGSNNATIHNIVEKYILSFGAYQYKPGRIYSQNKAIPQ